MIAKSVAQTHIRMYSLIKNGGLQEARSCFTPKALAQYHHAPELDDDLQKKVAELANMMVHAMVAPRPFDHSASQTLDELAQVLTTMCRSGKYTATATYLLWLRVGQIQELHSRPTMPVQPWTEARQVLNARMPAYTRQTAEGIQHLLRGYNALQFQWYEEAIQNLRLALHYLRPVRRYWRTKHLYAWANQLMAVAFLMTNKTLNMLYQVCVGFGSKRLILLKDPEKMLQKQLSPLHQVPYFWVRSLIME
ncbi:MAG TPA: hypothetical protein VFO38_01735 [Candidatus Saccharimonadales bacterium]|nr:hypothetical protein [Candidatus Saccharimonadales bacterium]